LIDKQADTVAVEKDVIVPYKQVIRKEDILYGLDGDMPNV